MAETKLDDSFPSGQFILEGYKKPYRLDINGHSGGILVYVNSDSPSRQITTFTFDTDMQIILIELNLRKHKWLICAIYRPPRQNLKLFHDNLSNAIDFYSTIQFKFSIFF